MERKDKGGREKNKLRQTENKTFFQKKQYL